MKIFFSIPSCKRINFSDSRIFGRGYQYNLDFLQIFVQMADVQVEKICTHCASNVFYVRNLVHSESSVQNIKGGQIIHLGL